MNEIPLEENREPEEILLDAPEAQTETAQGPLQQWLRTHTETSDEDADAEAPPDLPRPRRWRGVAGGACALVLAAAAITTVAPHPHPSTASESTVASPRVSDHPVELVTGTSSGCAHSATEQQILAVARGAVPVRDGGQAIAVFEAAYYRDRDGGRARALVAESAAVADAPAIQAGIDSIPVGTTYCARIRRLDLGLYGVEIHEVRPGEPESIWRQQIATSDRDGHTLITAITQL
ncbi:hypothetical protein GPX89_07615 [Nocardia sp. ET3-3]|uniref:DUF8176 domain-containing protein n=1 Tax=Nocardia terrae TaxID=2675851 RepID=A0A7K1US03_9NOCA|nr:hypothetical protein [Nocardia terrae]MVU77114.1 hypothetical protein [Nocardia terrae]